MYVTDPESSWYIASVTTKILPLQFHADFEWIPEVFISIFISWWSRSLWLSPFEIYTRVSMVSSGLTRSEFRSNPETLLFVYAFLHVCRTMPAMCACFHTFPSQPTRTWDLRSYTPLERSYSYFTCLLSKK